MTLLEIVTRLLGQSASKINDLRTILENAATSNTDLAPLAQEWLALFDQEVARVDLATTGVAVVKELGQIATGHLDPRDHPSDAA